LKERIVTLGLALAAFALFYALLVPKPEVAATSPAAPLSTEGRDDGYQGLWRWLHGQGIPLASFRDHYDGLAMLPGPDTGNLMIAVVPQKAQARRDELGWLDAWIGRGNTLLVLAALDDTPAWELRTGDDFLPVLTRMTDMSFSMLPASTAQSGKSTAGHALQRAIDSLADTGGGSIVPQGSHPLLAGVRSIATHSTYPSSRWTARAADGSEALVLGGRGDRPEGSTATEPAFWLRRHGQGQVIVMAFASPFSNAMLGQQDNARLFANILAWSRAPDGVVLFDDAHQGLVSYYDAHAFFADPRLHHTLLWICLLWLLFVLGWQRLRPPADPWNPPDVTTFIKVTGGFLAGRVGRNQAGQRLLANFFNRIRRRLAMPQNGQPVWEWLAAQATLPAAELEQLRALHARAQGRQPVDLVRLQNCLTKVTGSLL